MGASSFIAMRMSMGCILALCAPSRSLISSRPKAPWIAGKGSDTLVALKRVAWPSRIYMQTQLETITETALAVLWTTPQEKVNFDHGETPLPNASSHHLAHYTATTCGSTVAVTTAVQGNEGRMCLRRHWRQHIQHDKARQGPATAYGGCL